MQVLGLDENDIFSEEQYHEMFPSDSLELEENPMELVPLDPLASSQSGNQDHEQGQARSQSPARITVEMGNDDGDEFEVHEPCMRSGVSCIVWSLTCVWMVIYVARLKRWTLPSG